jgi:hypothetical protein
MGVACKMYGMTDEYKILVWNQTEKPRLRFEDNIEVVVEKMVYEVVGEIHLAQNGVH